MRKSGNTDKSDNRLRSLCELIIVPYSKSVSKPRHNPRSPVFQAKAQTASQCFVGRSNDKSLTPSLTQQTWYFFLLLNDPNGNDFICNKHFSHISIILHCLYITNNFYVPSKNNGKVAHLLVVLELIYWILLKSCLTTRIIIFLVCFYLAFMNVISKLLIYIN